ncbi:hypothetical protein GCM10027614_34610 [Micromonospora vulcania]
MFGEIMTEDATQAQSATTAPVTGGTNTVDDDVLEKLAVNAARSVDGVTDLGGTRRGCSTRCSTGSASTRLATRRAVPRRRS